MRDKILDFEANFKKFFKRTQKQMVIAFEASKRIINGESTFEGRRISNLVEMNRKIMEDCNQKRGRRSRVPSSTAKDMLDENENESHTVEEEDVMAHTNSLIRQAIRIPKIAESEIKVPRLGGKKISALTIASDIISTPKDFPELPNVPSEKHSSHLQLEEVKPVEPQPKQVPLLKMHQMDSLTESKFKKSGPVEPHVEVQNEVTTSDKKPLNLAMTLKANQPVQASRNVRSELGGVMNRTVQ